jgi:hypothetical protein
MRNLLAVLLACTFAAALLAGSAVATTTNHCGTVDTPTGKSGPVTVTGTGCRTARYVARTFSARGRVKTWHCTATAYQGGATVVCRRSAVRVRYQVAD